MSKRHFSKLLRYPSFAFLLLLAVAFCGGCQPPRVVSQDATAWQAVEKDPLETDLDLDRWPGWRGTNAAGIAPGGSPPVQFGPQKSVRWVVDVPGQGYSSPVVWGRSVFITSALGKSEPAELVVLCYDRTRGDVLWQASAGKTSGRTHIKNGYASASVATDGQRVYAFFGGTGLFCFDLAGKPLWHAELGEIEHMWGTAASPVLYGDTVIQLCDSQADSYLAAFDKQTGQRRWRVERPSIGCWTTPIVVRAMVDGKARDELIVNGTCKDSEPGLVIAYDPASGDELWRVRGTETLVTPTMLSAGDLVFSLSGRNGPIMAIRPGGSGDVTAQRLVWRLARGGPYIPSGVVYRNRLYVLGDSRSVSCYNPGNGDLLWQANLNGTFTSSLVAADGRLYAINEKGDCFVLAAGDTFKLLATNRLQERCLTTPAIVDGQLILRTEKKLYCFSK